LKKRFNIRIMGHEYSVVSDRGDEYVESVVRYLNDKAREMGNASKNISQLDIAILVALNTVDDLFRIREEKEIFHSQLENRSQRLINYINEKM